MKATVTALIALATTACSSVLAQGNPQQSIPKLTLDNTPEPSTIVLMGVALLGGGGYAAWKRRHKK